MAAPPAGAAATMSFSAASCGAQGGTSAGRCGRDVGNEARLASASLPAAAQRMRSRAADLGTAVPLTGSVASPTASAPWCRHRLVGGDVHEERLNASFGGHVGMQRAS